VCNKTREYTRPYQFFLSPPLWYFQKIPIF